MKGIETVDWSGATRCMRHQSDRRRECTARSSGAPVLVRSVAGQLSQARGRTGGRQERSRYITPGEIGCDGFWFEVFFGLTLLQYELVVVCSLIRGRREKGNARPVTDQSTLIHFRIILGVRVIPYPVTSAQVPKFRSGSCQVAAQAHTIACKTLLVDWGNRPNGVEGPRKQRTQNDQKIQTSTTRSSSSGCFLLKGSEDRERKIK